MNWDCLARYTTHTIKPELLDDADSTVQASTKLVD